MTFLSLGSSVAVEGEPPRRPEAGGGGSKGAARGGPGGWVGVTRARPVEDPVGVMRAWPAEDQELRGPRAGTGTWLAEGPGGLSVMGSSAGPGPAPRSPRARPASLVGAPLLIPHFLAPLREWVQLLGLSPVPSAQRPDPSLQASVPIAGWPSPCQVLSRPAQGAGRAVAGQSGTSAWGTHRQRTCPG